MSIRTFVSIFLVLGICSPPIRSQESKLNTSLGAGVTAPMGSTKQLVGAGMNVTVGAGSTALGGNAGAGFTIKFHEEGYCFYVEARYHYAPTRSIATQVLPITLGFRF